MSRFRSLLVLGGLFALLGISSPLPKVTAQDDRHAEVLDRVARAERLREFGYSGYAKTQLDLASKIEPAGREVLLGLLELSTRGGGDRAAARPWVGTLVKKYPDDYRV